MGNKNSVSDIPRTAENSCESTKDPIVHIELEPRVSNLSNSLVKQTAQKQDCQVVMEPSQVQEQPTSLEILEVVQKLPNETAQLESVQQLYSEILIERGSIVKKLRSIADHLSKTHKDVLIANKVGTGVGIGSGILFIGGLLAAPFTAGGSIIATGIGSASGFLGGLTSAGANLADYFILKSSLKKLQQELEEHNVKMEKLSSLMAESKCLVDATRFRPTMEQLASLSERNWMTLFSTFQSLISLALRGEYPQIDKVVEHVADPRIKELLHKLPIPLDANSLHALTAICSQILAQIEGISQGVKAFVNYLKKPEVARMAVALTSMKTTGQAAGAVVYDAAEIRAAFKGTPLAMSRAVRGAAAALAAVFVIIDIIQMVRICRETGETPPVEQLRKLADDLESDI